MILTSHPELVDKLHQISKHLGTAGGTSKGLHPLAVAQNEGTQPTHRALRRLYVPLSVAKLVAGKAWWDGTKGVQNGCGTSNQQPILARGNG